MCDIKELQLETTQVTECTFRSTLIEGFEADRSSFIKTDFMSANISRFKILASTFTSSKFINCFFDDASLVENVFLHLNIDQTRILNSKFVNNNVRNCEISGLKGPISFEGLKFEGLCRIHSLIFANFDFTNTILTNSHFQYCNFTGTRFKGAHLNSVTFDHCVLTQADLRYAHVDTKLEFVNVECDKTKIELYQLKKLKNYGGLTESQLSDMEIEDGLTELKTNFTGFLQWLHLFSILAFLSPYIAFLIKLSTQSKLFTNNDTNDPKIISVFSEYVYTGGKMNGCIHWTFVIFLMLLVYNLFRGLLLFRTKKMELYQTATGISKRFTLNEKIGILGIKKMTYNTLYKIVKYGTYVNFGLVILHVILFMARPVHNPTFKEAIHTITNSK